jgi:hypothetical protein
MHAFFQWLWTVTGSNNTSGLYYGFWSGFGSDLGEVALLGAVFGFYKHHNCAVRGCPRIGKHPVERTGYKTCHHHTTQEIHDQLRGELHEHIEG